MFPVLGTWLISLSMLLADMKSAACNIFLQTRLVDCLSTHFHAVAVTRKSYFCFKNQYLPLLITMPLKLNIKIYLNES